MTFRAFTNRDIGISGIAPEGWIGTGGEIHHFDRGCQYAAMAYTEMLQDANVQTSPAEVGAAWQNGYAEPLLRTTKEEEVDLSDCTD